MSMYAGDTAGRKYNNSLAMAEERMGGGMGRGGRGGGYGPTITQNVPALSPKAPDEAEVPMQHGEPITATPETPVTAETEKLPDFMRWAGMGNYKKAEQIFNANGKIKVVPGSTRHDADGNLITKDADTGEEWKVPKSYLDQVAGGVKPKAPLTDLETREKEAKIKSYEEGKPISKIDQAKLDKQKRLDQEEIDKADSAVEIARKAKEIADKSPTSWFNRKTEKEREAAGLALDAAIAAQKSKRKSFGLPLTPEEENAPAEKQAEPAPKAATPRGKGIGTMSTGSGAAVVLDPETGVAPVITKDGKKGYMKPNIAKTPVDQRKMLENALRSGKHPDTGKPLTPEQMDAAEAKLASMKK